ncbi:MAG TPA: VWA domain-containing protein [Pyrinomonadaceae bacterium]|nr:VWA domain-containing protein [Pyrinomonadaceae bacterium]
MNRTRLSILSLGVSLVLCVTSAPSILSQTAAPPAEVRLTVTVSDSRGRYVAGLSKDKLTLLEEKVPREITFFEESNQPAAVGLVFDLSRGRRERLLPHVRKAFLDFVSRGKSNEYFVVGYDAEAYLAADWGRSPGELARGFERLAAVKPSNKSVLHDALALALKKVGEGKNPRRLLILVSDGTDDGSKTKSAEVLEQLRRGDAAVYSVNARIGDEGLIDSSDFMKLSKLGSVSGGLALSARSAPEFYEFFERLSVELEHQYTLGFVPHDATGSGWRRLEFKAKALEFPKSPTSKKVEKFPLSVRSREGYYYGG